MFKLKHLKETIAVLIPNAISDHEMSFEIRYTIKHNFRLKLGKSYSNLPVCLQEKECNSLQPLSIFAKKVPLEMFDQVANTPL